jgi:Zn-dependent M28 family amino/carboxypeptidase
MEGDRAAGPGEPRNVLGVIPGSSDELVVLAAPYDTKPFESFEFVGANDGGSGAALLLGLAGILARDPLPYTIWLLFLDGEAEAGEEALRGSRAEAARLRRDGLVPRVRLLVVLNRICDPDLRIARDLLSHRIYRDEFWRTASRLGYREFFEQEKFEQPPGAHWPFRSAGLRRVIAIMDTSFGGEEPPGLYADTEDDDLEHCAESSLEVVGAVTLQALQTITTRLVKIDRFSTTPALQVAESDEGEAPPAPEQEADPAEPESIEAPPSADPDPSDAGPPSADS